MSFLTQKVKGNKDYFELESRGAYKWERLESSSPSLEIWIKKSQFLHDDIKHFMSFTLRSK